jgi:hypothetical protein
MKTRTQLGQGDGYAAGSEPDPEALAASADIPAELLAASALERSRAELRGMLEENRELHPGSGQFPRSRLMRAAMASRYRTLLLAGGAATVLLVGRRLPTMRIAALVNGYRLARRFWPSRTR